MSKDFSSLLGGALANKQSNDFSIRERIIICDEFKELIPQLKQDEFEQLEENILKEGVRDPLIIWPKEDRFILIDGHNRYSICTKHKLEFPFKKVDFKNDDEAKAWMVNNQLGRRNLSPEQQSYLRGLRYNQEKTQGKRSDLTSGQNDQKLEPESTAGRLGKEYGVSEKTIIRDGQFAEGVDVIGKENPELKNKILAGTSNVTKEKIKELAKRKNTRNILKPKAASTSELLSIAFDYARMETNSFEAVCRRLNVDPTSITSKEYFSRWNSVR